jgi:hypothetical protein
VDAQRVGGHSDIIKPVDIIHQKLPQDEAPKVGTILIQVEFLDIHKVGATHTSSKWVMIWKPFLKVISTMAASNPILDQTGEDSLPIVAMSATSGHNHQDNLPGGVEVLVDQQEHKLVLFLQLGLRQVQGHIIHQAVAHHGAVHNSEDDLGQLVPTQPIPPTLQEVPQVRTCAAHSPLVTEGSTSTEMCPEFSRTSSVHPGNGISNSISLSMAVTICTANTHTHVSLHLAEDHAEHPAQGAITDGILVTVLPPIAMQPVVRLEVEGETVGNEKSVENIEKEIPSCHSITLSKGPSEERIRILLLDKHLPMTHHQCQEPGKADLCLQPKPGPGKAFLMGDKYLCNKVDTSIAQATTIRVAVLVHINMGSTMLEESVPLNHQSPGHVDLLNQLELDRGLKDKSSDQHSTNIWSISEWESYNHQEFGWLIKVDTVSNSDTISSSSMTNGGSALEYPELFESEEEGHIGRSDNCMKIIQTRPATQYMRDRVLSKAEIEISTHQATTQFPGYSRLYLQVQINGFYDEKDTAYQFVVKRLADQGCGYARATPHCHLQLQHVQTCGEGALAYPSETHKEEEVLGCPSEEVEPVEVLPVHGDHVQRQEQDHLLCRQGSYEVHQRVQIIKQSYLPKVRGSASLGLMQQQAASRAGQVHHLGQDLHRDQKLHLGAIPRANQFLCPTQKQLHCQQSLYHGVGWPLHEQEYVLKSQGRHHHHTVMGDEMEGGHANEDIDLKKEVKYNKQSLPAVALVFCRTSPSVWRGGTSSLTWKQPNATQCGVQGAGDGELEKGHWVGPQTGKAAQSHHCWLQKPHFQQNCSPMPHSLGNAQVDQQEEAALDLSSIYLQKVEPRTTSERQHQSWQGDGPKQIQGQIIHQAVDHHDAVPHHYPELGQHANQQLTAQEITSATHSSFEQNRIVNSADEKHTSALIEEDDLSEWDNVNQISSRSPQSPSQSGSYSWSTAPMPHIQVLQPLQLDWQEPAHGVHTQPWQAYQEHNHFQQVLHYGPGDDQPLSRKLNQHLLCLQEGDVQGGNGHVRCDDAPHPPGTGHPLSNVVPGEYIVHGFLHHLFQQFITQASRLILLKLISMHYNREDWFDNAMLADNTNINVMHSFPDFMVFTFATLVMSNVEMATVDIYCLDSATTRSVCR